MYAGSCTCVLSIIKVIIRWGYVEVQWVCEVDWEREGETVDEVRLCMCVHGVGRWFRRSRDRQLPTQHSDHLFIAEWD